MLPVFFLEPRLAEEPFLPSFRRPGEDARSDKAPIIRNAPDSSSFAASIAPFTGYGNGKSPSLRAKGNQALRPKRSNAEAHPIGLYQSISLP
jgi:hypothetical protein